MNFNEQVAKRVLQKHFLWLVRVPTQDIAQLHAADFTHKYNHSYTDMVELAAVYSILPERFVNDPTGKKLAWKDEIRKYQPCCLLLPHLGVVGCMFTSRISWSVCVGVIEATLKQMIIDRELNVLPKGKCRHPSYEGEGTVLLVPCFAHHVDHICSSCQLLYVHTYVMGIGMQPV